MTKYYFIEESNGDAVIFCEELKKRFEGAELLGEFENAEEARREYEWRKDRKNIVYCYIGNMYELYKFSGKYAFLWDMNTGEELKVTTEYIRKSGAFDKCVKIRGEWYGIGIDK